MSTFRTKYEKIHDFMADIMPKKWSCHDLQHSLFLAPDGPRVCCKRFFVDGEMRGDVKCDDRNDLIQRINAGESTDCDGCPHLKFKDWGEPKITYLSIEHYRKCNLRCSYCSEEYYDGGTNQHYMIRNLPHLKTIIWGGGEPSLNPQLPATLDHWMLAYPDVNHRILTNATIYSRAIADALKTGKASITTSVDAGTPETFKKIRGADKLHDVIENLKRYAAIRPEAVTIKYILTDGNESADEIKAFAKLIEPLKYCNFQISRDFKRETVGNNEYDAAWYLRQQLLDAGAEVAFYDDLLMERITVKRHKHIIWGAGPIAEKIANNSKAVIIVDDTPELQGTTVAGHKVHAPEDVDLKSRPIVIAASQSYPEIYRKLKAKGLL